MDSIRQRIAKHPVAAFLLILYPVSWILFLPSVLGKSGLGFLPVDIPAQVGSLLLTIFGVTGVAFLVTRIADGKAGRAPCAATTTSFAPPRTGISSPSLALLFSC